MAKFKVGDRVKHIDGKHIGVIKELFCVVDRCRYLVDYGVFNSWTPEAELNPVCESVCIPKPTWRIIIEGDENTSRARYIVGKQTVKEATAKRYHLDFPEPSVAARVLVDKMFPHTAENIETPKPYEGRVVFHRKPYPGYPATVGKIYKVTNGKFVNDNGANVPLEAAASFDKLNDIFSHALIEIKED